jgi:thioredoxin reductase (NADPH)
MDLAIIGAGPIGLFAAFQAGLLGMKVCVIDALDFVGGQCAALYPEKPIYDIPAHPSILASDLIKNLEVQARHFKTVFHLGQEVIEITREGGEGYFSLRTSKGNVIKAKTILIAAGNGSFAPNKPNLEGIEKHENKSIFYSVTNKNHFKGKHLVIFGGGDSAIDWSIELAQLTRSITLVHRREKFRCAEGVLEKAQDLKSAGRLDIIVSHQLMRLIEDESSGMMQYLVIADADGNEKHLPSDYALFFFGVSILPGPISQWGLEMERRLIKVNSSSMVTSIPGIYGAGDIVSYPGKLKLITNGFAEAATACHAIQKYLNPDKPQILVHSTSQAKLFNEI